MGDSFRTALDNVVAFLPALLLFIVILAIGYFIAKALEKVLVKVLEKVGFDRAVERGGIKKALQNSQYDASQILAKIVFYAVMLFVLSTAFGVFGQNPISDYLAAIIGYLPKVFVAILILVIAAAVAAGVKLLVQNTLGSLSYGKVLATVASTVILALGVIAALNQLEIAQNVVNAVLYATLAALVGVVVVAVGGGGIVPMRERWEKALSKVEEEAPNVKREAANASSPREALRQEAQQYRPDSGQQGQQYGGQQYDAQQGQQYPAQPQYSEQQQYAGQQQYGQPQTGQQYGASAYGQQPFDQQQGDPGQAYGDQGQRYGQGTTEQYGTEGQRYGQPEGQQAQQYGQPQGWSTDATPVPDPSQAYAQPPIQQEDPGTQQLPRATGYEQGPDQQR